MTDAESKYARFSVEERQEAQQALFEYLKQFGSISVFEAKRLLVKYDSVGRGTLFLRNCLKDLHEQGLVEVIGQKRSRRYVKKD